MPATTAIRSEVSRASNAFAAALHRAIAALPGNLATSPASIATALAMTWIGARGQTEEEIRSVLHLEGSRADILAQCSWLARALHAPGSGVTLRLANRLFGSDTLTIEPEFQLAMRDVFLAGLEQVDFAASEAARARINGWVAEKTEQRICDLLPPKSIDATTKLALVNAIYFLASWGERFPTELTYDWPFTIAPGQQKRVPTMHLTRELRVAQDHGLRVLELPYAGGSTAMLIALPDATDGLARIEGELAASTIERWRAGLASRLVEVSLPRFTVNPAASLALAPILAALGMPTAFDIARADLTGITTQLPGLYIAHVFHKAFVKVDEQGTEAAAASAVVVLERSVGALPDTFRVDHPFLFAIVDQASGLILFLGRVVDPTAG